MSYTLLSYESIYAGLPVYIKRIRTKQRILISYIEQAHYLTIILYSELCLIQTFKKLIDERLYDI